MTTAAPATRRRPAAARQASGLIDPQGPMPEAFHRQPAAPAATSIPVITDARGPSVHIPMSELVIPGVVLGLKTRMPTGVPPWPMVLIEGYEKSGKTFSAASFSGSPGISAMYWFDLSEGAADQYIKIPGADYQVVEHDGSFNDVLAATKELDRFGAAVLDAGRPPICIVIDVIGEVWEWMKDWANDLARSTSKARGILAKDPNAEITISPAHWNMANARFNSYLRVLKRFHGIVIMLAQGKEVAVIENGQPVMGKTAHKVEAQKSLPGAADLWVRLYRDEPGEIIGGRSLALDMRPGSGPKPLAENWSVHNLVFDLLGCEVGKSQVRQITDPKPDAVLPQQIADEACDPTTTLDRLHALRGLVLGSGYEDISVDNERGQEEMLLHLVDRFGNARSAAAREAGTPVPAAVQPPAAEDPGPAEAPAAEDDTPDDTAADPGPAGDPGVTPFRDELEAESVHVAKLADYRLRIGGLTSQPQVKPLWEEMKASAATGEITRGELDQLGAEIAAKGQEGRKAREAAARAAAGGQAAAA